MRHHFSLGRAQCGMRDNHRVAHFNVLRETSNLSDAPRAPLSVLRRIACRSAASRTPLSVLRRIELRKGVPKAAKWASGALFSFGKQKEANPW